MIQICDGISSFFSRKSYVSTERKKIDLHLFPLLILSKIGCSEDFGHTCNVIYISFILAVRKHSRAERQARLIRCMTKRRSDIT